VRIEQSTGPRGQHAAPAAQRARTNGVEAGLEAATRVPVDSLEAVVSAVGDAPERGGSENRHDDVRESGSQFGRTQLVASKLRRP
jgi:hypothetical protein